MIKKLLLLTFIIALVSAKLRVHAPQELRDIYDNVKSYDNKGHVLYNLANYGVTPYEHRISGRVMYPKHVDEDGSVTEDITACSPLQSIQDDYTETSMMFHSPILFILRGGCSFVTKSYNAEQAGAKMVIIMDNEEEDINSFVLSDDLSGHELSIATVMISYEDGFMWRDILDRDLDLIISLFFDGPLMKEKVNYDYWMSSMDAASYVFLENFYKNSIALSAHTEFTPHYAIYYCGTCKVDGWTKYDSPLCISGGRYCSPDPDGDGPEDGKDEVMEDLRQICIFKQKGIEHWWKYMTTFRKNCILPDPADVEACSYSNMIEAGIDVDQIQRCVENSFDISDYDLNINKDDNYYLAEERENFITSKVQMWPTLMVNKQNFRGDITENDGPMQFICEGFKEMPDVCQDFNDRYVEEPEFTTDPVEKKNYTMFYTLVITITLFALLIMVYIWRKWMLKRINREMSLQVSTAVDQYMKLAK